MLQKNYQKYNILMVYSLDILTSYVIDLHATELLPKLKAMYDTGCVNQMQCGKFEIVERDISDLSITPYIDYAKLNIYKQFAYLKSHFGKP